MQTLVQIPDIDRIIYAALKWLIFTTFADKDLSNYLDRNRTDNSQTSLVISYRRYNDVGEQNTGISSCKKHLRQEIH